MNILDSVFSLRKNTFFYNKKIIESISEIKKILKSYGFERPEINHEIVKNKQNGTVEIIFNIKKNKLTKINKINIDIEDEILKRRIQKYFNFSVYIPMKFQNIVDKIKKKLISEKYFFPEIKLNETYIYGDNIKSRSGSQN